MAWDVPWFRRINGMETPFARFLWKYTHVGGFKSWSAVALGLIVVAMATNQPGLLDVRVAAWTLVKMLVANASSVIFIAIVKVRINRKRPYLALENVAMREHVKNASGPSFPSGHVQYHFSNLLLVATVMEGLVPGSLPFWIALAIGSSALIALSRVACGVHYPTDVLAGFASGIAIYCITVVLTFPAWNALLAWLRGLFPW